MTIFGIGMRNIKTAVSVFIILVICGIFTAITGIYSTGFYGAISAINCMQSSAELTYKMGVERVLGSFIGATVALAFYTFYGMPTNYVETAVVVSLGIIIAIHITKVLKLPYASSIAGIIIVSCFTLVPKDAIALTMIVRCAETILGVVVITIINIKLFPYNPEVNNENS